MNAELVILILKVAVIAVTLLLAASMTALVRGNIWLHGRINYVFFGLTVVALFGLEVIVRFSYPGMVETFLRERNAEGSLTTHLRFSLPAAALLFLMLFTGIKRMRVVHISLGVVFLILWAGTFVTGVFYLPHQ